MPKSKKQGFMECFCDLMGDTEGMTQEEIIAELKEVGIDPDKLTARVEEIVRKYKEIRKLRPKSEPDLELEHVVDLDIWNPHRFPVVPSQVQYQPYYEPGKYDEKIIGYRVQLLVEKWAKKIHLCSCFQCCTRFCDLYIYYKTKKEAEGELNKVLREGISVGKGKIKPKKIIKHEIIPMYPSNFVIPPRD